MISQHRDSFFSTRFVSYLYIKMASLVEKADPEVENNEGDEDDNGPAPVCSLICGIWQDKFSMYFVIL